MILNFKLKLKERNLFPNKFFYFLKAILKSPYNICMITISFICLSKLLFIFNFNFSLVRILWITIDPFIFKGVWPRLIERLLYETVYSLLFSIYAIILWVWYYEFSQFNSKILALGIQFMIS